MLKPLVTARDHWFFGPVLNCMPVYLQVILASVLINIFGGIVRCDIIAEGIIGAVKEVGVQVPVVVRFEGNNAPKGVEALTNSDVDIIAATSLTDAAQLAVKAAGGAV